MIRSRPCRPALLALATLLAAGACELPGTADGEEGAPVARSGPHVLTVEETVALIEEREELPEETAVARAVANLWLDYTLLARAAGRDSTFRELDLEHLVRPRLDQQLVAALRDSVVQVDTTIAEEELRTLWSEEAPGARIRARHILLSFPEEATQAQRDSVRALAEELRDRARDGESFAELAQRHSQDPGSARRGGDLGEFGRGEMVPAFEEAAFALEPGQVSEPVESPFGLHVIKVEERTEPEFESSAEGFAQEVRRRRVFEAESTYVSGVMEGAALSVSDEAPTVVRQLSARPGMSLTGRAARRSLVEYRDGTLTAGDVLEFLRGQNFRVRAQVEQASDAQIESLLRDLVRRRLLVEEARRVGLEIPEGRRDSLVAQARASLIDAADRLALRRIEGRSDETRTETIDRAVRETLRETLANRAQVVSLGSLSFALRRELGGQVYEPALSLVVERLAGEDEEDGGAPADAAGGVARPEPGSGAAADSTP